MTVEAVETVIGSKLPLGERLKYPGGTVSESGSAASSRYRLALLRRRLFRDERP